MTADQVVNAHPAVRAGVQAAVDEYEARETLEAKRARRRQADVSVPGRRVPRAGLQAHPELATSVASLTTASAKALAEAALTGSSLDWRENFRPDPNRRVEG
ncbi:hypothetical protein ABZV60_34920 [Streptomyces sp. NPDC004787]|uniref:hypothetical protein n=1 Tax=Streptomyces sp. NPDC004787 TaxID=3154291 RepID=UPI0033BB6F91